MLNDDAKTSITRELPHRSGFRGAGNEEQEKRALVGHMATSLEKRNAVFGVGGSSHHLRSTIVLIRFESQGLRLGRQLCQAVHGASTLQIVQATPPTPASLNSPVSL